MTHQYWKITFFASWQKEFHTSPVAAINQSTASTRKDRYLRPDGISSENDKTLQHGDDRNEVSETNLDPFNPSPDTVENLITGVTSWKMGEGGELGGEYLECERWQNDFLRWVNYTNISGVFRVSVTFFLGTFLHLNTSDIRMNNVTATTITALPAQL